jgi:hypothetical protein
MTAAPAAMPSVTRSRRERSTRATRRIGAVEETRGGPGASAAWAHGASRYAAIRRVATHLPHESERHASAGGATASQDDVR